MSKTLLSLLVFLLFFRVTADAHKQHVHQYLTLQGYNLLKQKLNTDVTNMVSHVGGLEMPYYAGDRPWQRQVMTTGAWREDEEDIVFNYRSMIFPDPVGNYWAVSITHFFEADRGDYTWNNFSWHGVNLGDYPNAYNKLQQFSHTQTPWEFKYSDGATSHVSTFQKAAGGYRSYTWYSALGFAYSDLIDMYVNGRAQIVGYYDINGQWINSNLRPDILPCDVILGQGWRDAFVWEILGRMAHLIQDQSVPVHAHAAEHSDGDQYENWMGNGTNPHLAWSSANAGTMLDPYVSSSPLHYLMYITQQAADHFGSGAPLNSAGDDVIGGNPLPEETAYLQSLNLGSFGGPYDGSGPWDDTHLANIRDHTEPIAIRATAGLMYWFATEAGLLKKARYLTIFGAGTITVDGSIVSSGYAKGVNSGTSTTVTAPLTQQMGGATYVFSGWQELDANGAVIGSSTSATWNVTITSKITLKANYINPLSATLTGPSLQYGQTGTYTTAATGGTPPYSYAWWIQYPGGEELMVNGSKIGVGDDVLPNLPPPGDTWYACGSNSATLSHTAYQSFGFKCYVTDAAQTTVMAGPLYNYLGSGGAMMAKEGTATLQASVASLAEELPTESSLAAAYPNPFNPTTTLRFALKENAHVTLAVYDALGREVATLAKAPHGAGYYQYQWNASTASSGIYFARLTVETGNKSTSFSKMNKLLLVK